MMGGVELDCRRMETTECCVPPGFRFHPTDEELVGYYLRKKVAAQKIDLDVIREVDLYRIEPWDLQGINLSLSLSLSEDGISHESVRKYVN